MKNRQNKKITRRQVVTTFTIGAVAMTVTLPEKWKRPVVDLVATPAHAAASPAATTMPQSPF